MHETGKPSGGEKDAYEHVDILNTSGFDAYAVHLVGGPHRWFEHNTRVICGPDFWDLYDRRHDFVIVPETMGGLIGALPGLKVIFNKNLYYGFGAFDPGGDLAAATYTSPTVVAIFAVSEHNCQHLRFAFPNALVKRVYYAIDPQLYAYRELAEKKKRIVIVDKNRDEMTVLVQMLRARALVGLNRLPDYQITLLQGLSAPEAAEVMREAVLLISLSTHEGLPRVIVEALACGCLVAACDAGPLKEILPRQYGFAPGDLVGVARHIEAILADFPDGLGRWSPVIEAGRRTAAAYTMARSRDVVVEAWREILAAQASQVVVRG
jgi:hypothetical protein